MGDRGCPLYRDWHPPKKPRHKVKVQLGLYKEKCDFAAIDREQGSEIHKTQGQAVVHNLQSAAPIELRPSQPFHEGPQPVGSQRLGNEDFAKKRWHRWFLCSHPPKI